MSNRRTVKVPERKPSQTAVRVAASAEIVVQGGRNWNDALIPPEKEYWRGYLQGFLKCTEVWLEDPVRVAIEREVMIVKKNRELEDERRAREAADKVLLVDSQGRELTSESPHRVGIGGDPRDGSGLALAGGQEEAQ